MPGIVQAFTAGLLGLLLLALLLLAWSVRLRHSLAKRVREQQCLATVFRLTEDLDQDWSEVLQAVAEALPQGWSHHAGVVAEIHWDHHTYRSAPLAPIGASLVQAMAPEGLSAKLVVHHPAGRHRAFAPEERALLAAVAARLTNIHQRRVLAERLLDSEARHRKLFDDSRQPTLIVEGGHFIAANKAALQALRIGTPEALLGKTPADFSPPRQPDGEASDTKALAMMAIARKQGAHAFEWEHQRATGETFTAQVLLTALHHDGHTLVQVVWNDISAQKQAEREVAAYRAELEARVATRTAELAAGGRGHHGAQPAGPALRGRAPGPTPGRQPLLGAPVGQRH